MIKTALIDPTDGVAIQTEKFWKGPHKLRNDARSLLVTEAYKSHGVFKAMSFTAAITTNFVAPATNGSLILTDLIVNGDKTNGGIIGVRFTDGTDTAGLYAVSTTDAPVDTAISFGGRFQGWKDAYIEVEITANITGAVVLGYIKVPNGLAFNEWDELR